MCVVWKGASGRAAEVRGDLEGGEAAAGADGSCQS